MLVLLLPLLLPLLPLPPPLLLLTPPPPPLLQHHAREQGFPGAGADWGADVTGQVQGPPGQVHAALCMLRRAVPRCAVLRYAMPCSWRWGWAGVLERAWQPPAGQPVHGWPCPLPAPPRPVLRQRRAECMRCTVLHRVLPFAGCSPWRSWCRLTSTWSSTTPAERWAFSSKRCSLLQSSPCLGRTAWPGGLLAEWQPLLAAQVAPPDGSSSRQRCCGKARLCAHM